MAMEVRKIEIPGELSDYLEALDYECGALRELLCMAAERRLTDFAAYDAWTLDYMEKYKAFQIAKAQVEREYVRPTLSEGQRVSWSLDYAEHTLSITEVEA